MRTVCGYVRGEPVDLSVVQIDGHPVEIRTAQAFLRMLQHALTEKIDLAITSAFRTNEQQTDLYNRLRPLGIPTARPQHSSHQSGRAIDIRTGITFAEFRAGKRSPIFNWLHLNAGSHGFVRAVPSEPWHYEYTGD